jgi:hypothetical protein
MDSKHLIGLCEAYYQVYEPENITEEVDIAAEYFMSEGLNEYGVEILIEELGLDEFVNFVYDIAESYNLSESTVYSSYNKFDALEIALANQPRVFTEASALQNRLAGAILSGIERHKKATSDFSKTRLGKTLGGLAKGTAKGLTAVGDVGGDVAASTVRQVEKQIEKRKGGKGRYRGAGVGRRDEVISKPSTSRPSSSSSSGVRGALPPSNSKRKGITNPQGTGKHNTALRGRLGLSSTEQTKPKATVKEYYDLILGYLLDEGYADSLESAEKIMVNMSEEWIDEILDEKVQVKSAPTHLSQLKPNQSLFSASELTGYKTPEEIEKMKKLREKRKKTTGKSRLEFDDR